MNRGKRHNQLRVAAVGWLLALLCGLACSDESDPILPEEPEIQYATVTISVQTAENQQPSFTKAGDDPTRPEDNEKDPTLEEETYAYERHIQDWWIVILKEDNQTVRAVIKNTPPSTNPPADSETEVNTPLPIDSTFYFYAFANLEMLAGNHASYIQNLKEGDTFDPAIAVKLPVITTFDPQAEQQRYIPMSSYPKKHTISLYTNRIDLTLIRLVGKVSVEVTNATGKEVTLRSLMLDRFRSEGSIYLLPYDAAQGKTTENLLSATMESSYQPSFPSVEGETPAYSPLQWNAEGGYAIPTDLPYTFTSYANETDFLEATDEGGHPLTGLTIQLDLPDRNDWPIETDYSFIRRNDWLKIPILISEADVKITFQQSHMPIGGIPATITFQPGVTLGEQSLTTTHAGAIKIHYDLQKLNTTTDWALRYYTDGTTVTSKDQFCYVGLVTGTNENNFLLQPEASETDPMSWWVSSKPKPVDPAFTYKLTLDQDAQGNDSPTKGSFTINVQELSDYGAATFRLNLVATRTVDGTEQTIVLPYLITLNNGKSKPSQP